MSTSNPLKRFFKEPLVQFALVGGCIYGATFLAGGKEEEPETVVEERVHVDAAQIEGMVDQWEKRWQRLPTKEELDGLIQKHVRDEMLYRQASAMGLDRNDPVTRMRTVQKLEFLLNNIADAKQPTDPQLQKYFKEHEADYRTPDTITFYQAFFNPDRRKEATIEEAEAALAELRSSGAPDPATAEIGDQSMMKNQFIKVDQRAVARAMGSGFAESVMKLEPAAWHGPVLSGFGVHLVYVFEREEGSVLPFDQVKAEVISEWQTEQREEVSSSFLEELRKQYEIVIDEVPEGRFLAPPQRESDQDAAAPAESAESSS